MIRLDAPDIAVPTGCYKFARAVLAKILARATLAVRCMCWTKLMANQSMFWLEQLHMEIAVVNLGNFFKV